MKKKIAVLGSGWAFTFIQSVLDGIREELHETDTDIYFFTCYKFHNPDKSDNINGYRIFDLINYRSFDGIILLANTFEDEVSLEKVVKQIKAANIPTVSLVKKIQDFHYVHINNYVGFYSLIEHLVCNHNVKNLAFIGGLEGDPQNSDRYKAFETALKDNKIPINKKIIFQKGDWSFKNGYEKGQILLADKKNMPDAIVCSNDQAAFGVLKAAYENNINIPSDVKLIGFDNEDKAACTNPSLSTVDTMANEMGKEAVKLLFSKKKHPQDIELQSKPVIRNSCGCSTGVSKEQLTFPIRNLSFQDDEERFTSQLRHTEDVFVNDANIHIFWDSCQNFYEKRHQFEGENFSILLKKDLIKSMLFQEIEYIDNDNGKELQTFVNIQNGKKITPGIINTQDMLPQFLTKGEKNLFVFIPLIYHDYFYGYYVGKNNFSLIFNKRGYSWTKNFANNIEKFREKTKYRLLSQKYLGLSTKDSLSGTYNRTGLDFFAKEMFEFNRHSNFYTVIYFIDINYMKSINDKYGHLHGDLAIKVVAEEIKTMIPQEWLPIRYGGDEFVVIGSSKVKKIQDCFENLNDRLEQRTKEMSLPYKITVSYGCNIVQPDVVDSLIDEIGKVDKIMYVNKKAFHDRNPK